MLLKRAAVNFLVVASHQCVKSLFNSIQLRSVRSRDDSFPPRLPHELLSFRNSCTSRSSPPTSPSAHERPACPPALGRETREARAVIGSDSSAHAPLCVFSWVCVSVQTRSVARLCNPAAFLAKRVESACHNGPSPAPFPFRGACSSPIGARRLSPLLVDIAGV